MVINVSFCKTLPIPTYSRVIYNKERAFWLKHEYEIAFCELIALSIMPIFYL